MDNWKKIGIVAAGIAAVGAVAFLLQPVSPSPSSKVEQAPKPAAKRVVAPKSKSIPQPEPKKEPEPEPKKLTKEEFLAINKEIYDRTKVNLQKIKQKFLDDRRKVKQEPESYRRAAEGFLMSEQSLVKDSVQEVIASKKIPRNIYEEAENEFGADHAAASERETFKRSLTVKDEVNESITVDLLKEMLQAELSFIESLEIDREDPLAKIVTHARVEDFLFEKYALEMDEIQAARNVFQSEIKSVLRPVIRKYQFLGIN